MYPFLIDASGFSNVYIYIKSVSAFNLTIYMDMIKTRISWEYGRHVNNATTFWNKSQGLRCFISVKWDIQKPEIFLYNDNDRSENEWNSINKIIHHEDVCVMYSMEITWSFAFLKFTSIDTNEWQ